MQQTVFLFNLGFKLKVSNNSHHVTCTCKCWWHANTWLVSTLQSSITPCICCWCSHLQSRCEIWMDTAPSDAGKIGSKWSPWNNWVVSTKSWVDNMTNKWAVPLKSCWSVHMTGEGHHFSITGKLSSILYHSRRQHHIACKWNGSHVLSALLHIHLSLFTPPYTHWWLRCIKDWLLYLKLWGSVYHTGFIL